MVTMNPARDSLKTHVIFGTVGFLLGILISVLFQALSHGGASFQPERLTDESLRNRIQAFLGVPLPTVAGQLYYREEGFMDNTTHVGLSLPPGEAWPLIREFIGKAPSDFRPPETGDIIYEMEDSPLWCPSQMDAPLFCDVESEGQSHTLILYDQTVQRLLIRKTTF